MKYLFFVYFTYINSVTVAILAQAKLHDDTCSVV